MVQAVQTASLRAAARWPLVEWIAGIGLLAVLVYAHAGALAGMVNVWNVSPMYSYGYTVPLISLYLLWTKRTRLAELAPAPARVAGALVLLVGIGMLTAGRAGGIQVLQQLAFLVSLVGLVLLLLGRDYVVAAWAGLAYLLLMIPIWDGFTEPLHEPFQLRSAEIGASVLQGVGIPAYREGTLIALPSFSLEVARACSGVNYLVAVIALGLPQAYVYLQGFWKRAMLIIAAVLVAALSNGLRVALIGVLAHFEIGSPLHGPFHVLHGLFVSAAGYVVLFAGLWVLMPAPGPVEKRQSSQSSPNGKRRLPRPELVVTVLLFAAVGGGVLARQPQAVPLARDLESLPFTLDNWHGGGEPAAGGASLWPGADAEFRRRYRRADGAVVDVLVAYYSIQAQGREVANFRTADLHRRARPIEIRAKPDEAFTANMVPDRDGLARALFWYELGPVSETSVPRAKLRTMWSAVVHGYNPGMAVLLTSMGVSLSEADLQELGAVLRAALEEQVRRPGARDPL